MGIEYKAYLSRPLKVGGDINIEGVKWMCVQDCTLLGATIENNTPVLEGLDGLMLNGGQLMRAERFKTFPKPGQTYTEIMALSEYERIKPQDLAGKELKCVYRMDETFIAVCLDKTYVKFSAATEQWSTDLTLEDERLTIRDLHMLKLIRDITWKRHLEEEQKERVQDTARLYDGQFKEAVNRVGVDRATKLLEACRGKV